MSLPMIQDDVFVRDRRAGGFQFTEGADNVVRLHVALLRVILANHKNAGMSALRFLDQKVHWLEILVVPRQQATVLSDRLPQVKRVMGAGQTDFGRRPNVVSRLP